MESLLGVRLLAVHLERVIESEQRCYLGYFQPPKVLTPDRSRDVTHVGNPMPLNIVRQLAVNNKHFACLFVTRLTNRRLPLKA